MKKFIFITIIIFSISFSASSAQDLNPKALEELKVKIVQSGFVDVKGDIQYANLTLAIPQENVTSIRTVPENFKYVYDAYGNKLVYFEWQNPKGRITYSIETVVDNKAKHLPYEIQLGENQDFVKETESIIITPEIGETAYPYEKNLKGVADLTIWTNKYITYDKNYAQAYKNSKDIFENKKGVCSEYATLLSALLRSKGIATRYVIGYAYSSEDEKLIGHAWIEVLLKNNQWVAFDPTWLQGGYLDATHIKISNLPDNSQEDTLIYKGTGEMNWERNDDVIDIIDYIENEEASITLEKKDIAFNEYGYLKATVTSRCMIEDMEALSCVDNEIPVLEIYDAERNFWLCGSAEVYWFFKPINYDRNYIYNCPVTVFDQNGAKANERIKIDGDRDIHELFISGPDTVIAGKDLTLTGSVLDNFIFFSPDVGKSQFKSWNLGLKVPGVYKFYLYHEGGLAIKEVSVVKNKDFDIIIEYPASVKAEEPFAIVVNMTNLLSDRSFPKATLKFDDMTLEKNLLFNPGEKIQLAYNITSFSPGMKKATLLIETDTLHMYSIYVNVLEKDKNWLEAFADAIAKFFQGIAKAITGMFGEKTVRNNFL